MRCRLSYCVTNLSGCRVLRRDRCELLMAPGSPDFEVPVPVSPGSPAGIRTSCCAGRHCRMRLDESGFQMPAGWLRGIFPSLPRLACLRCCSDYFSFSCDLCKKLLKVKAFLPLGKERLCIGFLVFVDVVRRVIGVGIFASRRLAARAERP